MAETTLDFMAYKDLWRAAEGAERLILRLRAKAFALLAPDQEQSDEAFGELIDELENSPELRALRRALGRLEPLPPPLTTEGR